MIAKRKARFTRVKKKVVVDIIVCVTLCAAFVSWMLWDAVGSAIAAGLLWVALVLSMKNG